MRFVLIAVVCGLISSVRAQEPDHFVFGYEQFNGSDIYDVIQDNDHRYWFATNQGLFLHDGYTFQKVTCPEMQSLSVFNLRKDRNGIIYCYNLKNQVFRITNGEITLFHEIPAAEVNRNMYLEIDNEDRLSILSKGITTIHKGRKETNSIDLDEGKMRISFHLLNNGIGVALTQKEVAVLKDGQVTVQKIETDHNQSPVFSSWTKINGEHFAIDQSTMELYRFDPVSLKFQFQKDLQINLKESAIRTYRVLDQIWVVGNQNGAYVFDLDWNPLFSGELLFDDYYVSDVFEDQEGNVLLSTFDEGVLVIPDMRNRSVQLPNEEGIAAMCSDGNEHFFIGSSEGNVYNYNTTTDEINLLYQSPTKKPIEFITYWVDQKSLLYSSPGGYAISSWDGSKLTNEQQFIGSPKSAFFDKTEGYIALNSGIDRISFISNRWHNEPVADIRTRSFGVVKDVNHNQLVMSLSNGLFTLDESNELRELKYKGNRLISTSLAIHKDHLYVGTALKGVLVYKNRQLVKQISIKNPVMEIIPRGDELYIKTSHDVYVYDLKKNSFLSVNNTLGIGRKAMKDIEMFEGELLVTSAREINRLPLKVLNDDPEAIPITLERLQIGGKTVQTNEFDWSSDKYTFNFHVSSLKYRNNIKYRYKLKGYDNEWQYLDYENNSVSFKGLPAGNYEFIVQALNGSTPSNTERYQFVVLAPFYETGWFYFLIVVFISMVFYVLYYYRMRTLRKKNNELVHQQKLKTDLLQMELKALRSQMNPHFIFNSLNSIQHLVLKEDTDNSYDYLVLFAKLVRSTLNYSDLNFIPINQELEFLDVYLQLEELRFKEGFTYEVRYEGTDEIDVPPLIIQPFIENALVHGLLHKAGEKKLEVKLVLRDKFLLCTITDNGVGRAKAKEIQNRQNQLHKSFALNAIQQRLELMNKHLEEEIGHYEMEDLMENGEAIGTKVILQLPVQYRY